jgi:hypothetical protein
MKSDEVLLRILEAKNNNSTTLNLSFCSLSSLPSEIETLTHLRVLNLSNNLFSTIPTEVFKLKNLKTLELSENLIQSIPDDIDTLDNLTEIDLSLNHIAKVPLEITNIKNLTKLNLEKNLIRKLPSEIQKWKELEYLNVRYNKIVILHPNIGKLPKLKSLNCSLNKLTEIPIEISNLEKIENVDFSQNKIKIIPQGICQMGSLKTIDLSSNMIYNLPVEITNLNARIILGDNPLEIPPLEIVEKGKNAIIEYFDSLEDNKLLLNEVKVLLVGEGSAGKTSLVNRIIDNEFDLQESQTQGINIQKWMVSKNNKKIQVNFWDFGGQEIMHSTHQFFLSKRSLYILVLDGRKDEKPEYWLKHIESFGGSSPILIVINKIDENLNCLLNQKFLKSKYPSIKDFYRVSCKTEVGIESFVESLKKEMLEVEHLKTTWPKRWFEIKNKIENLNQNFISYEEYKQICDEQNLNKKISQDTLIDFLNDLGIVLHFKDLELLDTHVLEPKWVTNAVYKIINSEELFKNRGVLKLNLLHSILDKKEDDDYDYPVEKYSYIINLMKKFELCYSIDSDTVLIPELLEIQEPDFNFDKTNVLNFVIDYEDFLPKSIMPRFIVRMHEDIKDELKWRTGVVLENKEYKASAVVKSDEEAKKVYIQVAGRQKREYFSIILNSFRIINQSFTSLETTERRPLPDRPNVTVSYEHLIKLELLGEKTFVPEGAEKKYSVSELLGNVYVESIIPTPIYTGDFIMGDKNQYSAKQVIGAQGQYSQGTVNINNFQQIWNDNKEEIDLVKLADELELLKAEMVKEAKSGEEFEALTNVAHAQEAAQKGDGGKTFEYLSKAGKWTFNVAEKIGVGVAIAALTALI